jgi:alpha-tubulin suppressor-like RCC1 family protein
VRGHHRGGWLIVALVAVLSGCLGGASPAGASAGSGPPVNTLAPSISGTAQEGKTLKVKSGKWTGAKPIAYTYGWQLCDAEAEACGSSLGSASSLQLRPEWVGHVLRATVTATNGSGEATASALSSLMVVKGAPYDKSKPTISGTPALQHALTASQGRWTGKKPIAFAYQWQSCDATGGECQDIEGATESSFTPGVEQADHPLRVRVTASNSISQTPASSEPTTPVGFAPAAALAAGGDHTCAALQSGHVQCWGNGELGQLGNGGTLDSSLPVEVQGIADATAVAAGQGATEITAGSEHSCAVLATGHVECWGSDNVGQLGDGTTSTAPTSSPVEVQGIGNAVQVVAGYEHTCALLATGHVQCWGFNYHGELGDGTAGGNSATPVSVQGITSAKQLSAGWYHTCALLTGGHVDCWGWNVYGQLGNSSAGGQSATPVEVSGISTATDVGAGYGHTCATLAGGHVLCWGSNGSGQLGSGNDNSSATPVEVQGIDDATAVAAGFAHTCAVSSSGRVRCWGANYYGQLGNDSTLASSSPVEVAGVNDATAISVGYGHSCATLEDGGLRCWGYDYYGQLGDENRSHGPATVPVAAEGLTDATEVTAAYNFTCALVSGGTISCWGYNGNGQLGDPAVASSDTPVEVDGISDAVDVSAYYLHACATLADGAVDCWGWNGWGQLGDGTYEQSTQPVSVSGIASAVQVATGEADTCALLASGRVDCWGYNGDGQLGNAGNTTSTTPVEVQGIGNASQIAVGREDACALLTSGHILCWGNNGQGQLGDGSTKNASTPVEVTGIEDAVEVTLGSEHACALIAGGQVMCWGYNYHGELGIGTTGGYTTTPVEVDGLSGVRSIGAGDYHTCALSSAGATECWGENFFGQLGNGEVGGDSASPSEVAGVSAPTEIAGSWGDTCAVTAGGSVDCWGWSNRGQLGDGEAWRLLPTEVVGF